MTRARLYILLLETLLCAAMGLVVGFAWRRVYLEQEAKDLALLHAENAIKRGLSHRPSVGEGEWMFDLCIFGGPAQPALCTDRKSNPIVYYVTDQHMGADGEYCRAFASTDLRAVLAFMSLPIVPYRDRACAPDGVWPDWSKDPIEALKDPEAP